MNIVDLINDYINNNKNNIIIECQLLTHFTNNYPINLTNSNILIFNRLYTKLLFGKILTNDESEGLYKFIDKFTNYIKMDKIPEDEKKSLNLLLKYIKKNI